MTFVARFLGALLVLVLASTVPVQPRPRAAADARWTASWIAAPQDYRQLIVLFPPDASSAPAAFHGQSLREQLRPSIGGQSVRVRFSNRFGRAPLHIASASVAHGVGEAAVSPASLRRLSFGGRDDITIAPGAEAWSDAAGFAVEPGQVVSVSFHLDLPTAYATVYRLAPGATWTTPGDAVMRGAWRHASAATWNHIVTGLDVTGGPVARVVVAFGDSITEGTGAEEKWPAAARYPDRLAARLRGRTDAQSGPVAVLNAGIAGNRLLAEPIGTRGVERFARDVLDQSGVTHVLILIGINDIGFSFPEGTKGAAPPPTSEQITEGLSRLIAQAHARGVKVLLGTLLPFQGAAYWSEEKELRRQAVNHWIRSRRDVEAVVDFDVALRDPTDPLSLNPVYDSGDHLHPGNAGYAAMAAAVDLQVLEK